MTTDRPAGFWIGHPGALLPLPGVKGELSRTVERSVSYAVSAAGVRRAYRSARRAPLREWKVTIPGMMADEAAALHELLMHTDPPFVWVDPWARVTNVLTPAAAGLEATVPVLPQVGRQPLDGGGFAAIGAANPSGVVVRVQPAPVVPDLPVTVSAYLAASGPGYVAAVLLDSSGTPIASPVNSASVTGTDVMRRASVTLSGLPVNAAAVEIRVHGASVVARPAVTWTESVREYGPGGGAGQVVLSGLDEAVEDALLAVGKRRRAAATFTVTEVG